MNSKALLILRYVVNDLKLGDKPTRLVNLFESVFKSGEKSVCWSDYFDN